MASCRAAAKAFGGNKWSARSEEARALSRERHHCGAATAPHAAALRPAWVRVAQISLGFSSDAAHPKDNGQNHREFPGDNGPIFGGPGARVHCGACRTSHQQPNLHISAAGSSTAKRCSRSSGPLSLRGPRLRLPLSVGRVGSAGKHRGIHRNATPCGGPRGVLRRAASLATLRAATNAFGGKEWLVRSGVTQTLARTSPL